ncbi:MAG TPA: hypothetical protein VIK94_04515 [Bacilli bacterium]
MFESTKEDVLQEINKLNYLQDNIFYKLDNKNLSKIQLYIAKKELEGINHLLSLINRLFDLKE